MLKLHFWPGYIMQRCAFLSGLLLLAALIFCIKAETAPVLYPVLRRFSLYSQSLSSAVLCAGLVGGLLLEDGLRRRG